MTIIASCGHALADDEGPDGLGYPLALKATSADWSNAVHYVVFCEKCYLHAKEQGLILENEAEQMKYLNSN